MVWFFSCSSCWLSNSSSAISSAKSWMWTMLTCLSQFDFWAKTLEEMGHTLLLATVFLFVLKSVHIFKCFRMLCLHLDFVTQSFCWTVENIGEEWNLVFIVPLRSVSIQSFMFISIRFGTEWLFTILFTTSKNHLDKQSLQLNHNFYSKQIEYQKKTRKRLVFLQKQIRTNKNKFEIVQCKGFPTHSRQDI